VAIAMIEFGGFWPAVPNREKRRLVPENVDASLIGHSAPSLSYVRSKIATIVSIINRFMTFMTQPCVTCLTENRKGSQ